MVVGFYVHTDMNFVVTKRKEDEADDSSAMNGNFKVEAHALGGAFEE